MENQAQSQLNAQLYASKHQTVLQGMRAIASRTLLSSADNEGTKRNRTYCPATFNTADSYEPTVIYLLNTVLQHFLLTNV